MQPLTSSPTLSSRPGRLPQRPQADAAPRQPWLLRPQAWFHGLAERAGQAFAVEFPDGELLLAGRGEPRFRLVFRSPAALRAVLFRGHVGLLESYADQQIELEGDLPTAFATAMAAGLDLQPNRWNRLMNRLHEWRHSATSHGRAKANARAHYPHPPDFYRHWLDEEGLVYTCGYWPDGTQTLEQAQSQKIDHVCRKLRLQRGDCFVDLGCGFGGFLLRAHQTTGATGVGVNTTTEQVHWLREEIVRRGLSSHLQVREADFREVDGLYDKVVSIGVLEHAGRGLLDEAIRAHAAYLRPGGLGLLHFVGHIGTQETDLFIRKHIFPGGWLPDISEVLSALERHGLEVVDVENLRRHYALTLDVWAERFDRHWPEIRAIDPTRYDERFRRLWMSYLLGSAESFRFGRTHLFQIVFSQGSLGQDDYPMGREFLYTP